MQRITNIKDMPQVANKLKRQGQIIGFVPTMGFLHQGHLSLIEAARRETDSVVVSIFVNPIQFGPNEDFNTYPRDVERDAGLIEGCGGDILFIPEAKEMYLPDHYTYLQVEGGGLTGNLCGRFRPGHFRGVATVVAKLFHLVKPDIAYFGEKDYQQLMVIKKMVTDLNMDVEIKGLPTVREEDGLAMSSRNSYLNREERQAARCLYRSLVLAGQMVKEGMVQSSVIIEAVRKVIEAEALARPQYIQICHPKTLENLEVIKDKARLVMAVYIGKTRLIDNCLLGLRR